MQATSLRTIILQSPDPVVIQAALDKLTKPGIGLTALESGTIAYDPLGAGAQLLSAPVVFWDGVSYVVFHFSASS